MGVDWTGYSVSGTKNIFMKRLIEYDKELFLSRPQGKFHAYTRTCPAQYKKQPVVLNDRDKNYIDKQDEKFGIKSYDEHITYGSGVKKIITYVLDFGVCKMKMENNVVFQLLK